MHIPSVRRPGRTDGHSRARSRTTRYESRLFTIQLLCFTLFFQATGIAQALPPRLEEKVWVSHEEVTGPGLTSSSELSPEAGRTTGGDHFLAESRELVERAWQPLSEWVVSGWQAAQSEVGEAFSAVLSPRRPEPMQLASLLPTSALLAAFAVQDDQYVNPSREHPPTPPRRHEGAHRDRLQSSAPLEGALPLKATGSDVPLLTGFNLVSIPDEPPNTDPAVVLGAIAGQLSSAFAYDACDASDPWKLYDPTDPVASDLAAIDHTQGLWIDVTAPTVLPVTGTQPATTQIQLCTGWNLIGYPLAQARPVAAALASIAGKYVRVFGFELGDAADPWEIYDIAAPAWANDLQMMQRGHGYWVLVAEDTVLDYENTGALPVVEITAPGDLGEVTAPTDVIGNVESNSLERWTLSFRPSGESDATFVEIGTGNVPGTGLNLGAFDPTLLLNGLYDLKLEAVDFSGQIVEDVIAVAVDGQMKIGNFTLSFTDLSIPLSGLDIAVVRTYDSRDKEKRDFGVGWTLDIKQGSYVNNRTPGEGWQVLSGTFPCTSIQETLPHLTTIRLSDREVYRFRLRLANPATVIGGCFADADFEFLVGTQPGASLEILGNTQVIYQNGSNLVIDADSLEVYEPQGVRLRTPDGRLFEMSLEGGVTALQDLNGNRVDITSTGITHSSGRGITFVRDTEGRITSIIEPSGETLDYVYDARGDLESFSDQAGASTSFAYDDNHGLIELRDPFGNPPVRNEYDDDGRLVRHIDTAGNVTNLTHDISGRREVVSDRLGRSRILEYDDRGNVIRETDAEGGVTVRTYGVRDNLVTETDPQGNTTTRTYDANDNLTSIESPRGEVISFTFDADNRMLTSTDALARVTTLTYDPAGNLTSTTDSLGNVTSFTYDTFGNQLTESDPEGALTQREYDAFGNATRVIDPIGNETVSTYDTGGRRLTETRSRTTSTGVRPLVTSFTYDEVGRLLSTVHPDGTTTSASYDGLGNLTSATDRLGRVSQIEYDSQGRVTRIQRPDGLSETRTYDAEGRRLSSTDHQGRTTSFTYDTLGRLISQTFPDGASEARAYDSAGRLISMTNALGQTTSFEYDAAGNQIAVVDALGNRTSSTYDATGTQLSQTDPKGQTAVFEVDALDRLVRTTFPDGTSESTVYDGAGRAVSQIDQAGNETQFEYDLAGRVTAVIDALGQRTSFVYDEVGNRLEQTDANGHTTRFEYGDSGRLTRRILPDGAVEERTYDAAGNLTTLEKLDGREIHLQYDALNRLTSKTLPGGTTFSFTYTASGQRASVSDLRGLTTYTYDARDRLSSLTYPSNDRLDYEYDSGGNLTRRTALLGLTSLETSLSYDALNRLSTVTDPDGEVYSHTYDDNGNRASLVSPNGVETDYSYDSLNRLVDLATRTGVGTVLQSYNYTLGPAGNRTRIDEADGTQIDYGYDATFRLTSATTTAVGGLVTQEDFIYDPVGNRSSRTLTDSDGPVTTTYTYDVRDRMLTENAAAFSWEVNGGLASRSGSLAQDATFTWDVEDRLVAVDFADGSQASYTYDADGNRVAAVTTPASGPAESVNYLVDPTGLYSQVVAETNPSAGMLAYYVRGDDLLAAIRPTSKRYFHADGQGSVRRLTDTTGAVTDVYTFTPFGELDSHLGFDPNAYLFAGEQIDPNVGFYYLRARWMDPSVGRFASMDPFGGVINDPRSLHKYTYAGNDPVNKVDPSGLFFIGFSGLLGRLAIQGLISGLIAGGLTYYTTRDVKKSLTSAFGGFVVGFLLGGAFYAVRGFVAARSFAAFAPLLDDAVIASDKLRYLLVIDSGKANGFRLLGYAMRNSESLRNMLAYSRTLISPQNLQAVTQYGQKWKVAMEIVGANGRRGLVEVVWQLDKGSGVYRLITAIPKPF